MSWADTTVKTKMSFFNEIILLGRRWLSLPILNQ